MLSKVTAGLAVAGGVIHLAVVRHHVDYPVITAGFALMGSAQLLVAVGLLTRSAPRVRVAALLLHAGIVATWLLSRTVGLLAVPGAEERAAFGAADTIANMFAVGVIASLATISRVGRRRVRLSARVARGVVVVAGFATVALALPAVFAPHDHAGHDHPATEPAPGLEPPADGHDDHAHDHG